MLEKSEVYSLRVIINGSFSFVGSDESRAKDQIDPALNDEDTVEFDFVYSIGNDMILIRYMTSIEGCKYYLNAAITEDIVST